MSTLSEQTHLPGLHAPQPKLPASSLAADILVLVKARLTSMVLVTTLVGFLFGWRGPIDWLLLFHTLFGTFLAAAGASALNQAFECDYDARMRRTKNRPIPTHRISRDSGLFIGVVTSAVGVVYLSVTTNLLAALLAALTIGTYVFVYTPLKRVTTLNTIVGAVPGALPPVIGWAAARGEAGLESWLLFTILFLWQMPHFLAIAWLYRDDYRQAGFRMLSSQDTECRLTGRLALLYSMGLLSVSLLPFVLGLTSFWYVPVALVAGLAFSIVAFVFALHGTERAARRLFLMSIFYLPVTLGCLVLARA
ncbi:MAG: heme o synthase [Chthoniobacterales bacterium]|jgi:heme o synthase